jgi:hypothetical protein
MILPQNVFHTPVNQMCHRSGAGDSVTVIANGFIVDKAEKILYNMMPYVYDL